MSANRAWQLAMDWERRARELERELADLRSAMEVQARALRDALERYENLANMLVEQEMLKPTKPFITPNE